MLSVLLLWTPRVDHDVTNSTTNDAAMTTEAQSEASAVVMDCKVTASSSTTEATITREAQSVISTSLWTLVIYGQRFCVPTNS